LQKVFVYAVIASLAASSVSHAGITVQGFFDCAEWVTARQNSAAGNSPAQEGFARAWTMGFISGLAISAGKEFFDRPSGSISGEQVSLWMDNYCAQNPMSDIVNGAELVFDQVTSP
jgi:hypothetical protein